eukprot:TRINITY_DN50659_c0_g1_i1.p1 TRINITY_DN50659_c0_g1~~TRINITY_DN50659_c0_g1_i1.p1  ORF type:complete len:334 (-),score=116.74 TRINITY_DN50659_c0_g1_i1:77-1078(-)
MMKLQRCMVAALLFGACDATLARKSSEHEPTPRPPEMPWIGKHMVKGAKQQVTVAEMASESAKKSAEEVTVEHQGIATAYALESAEDASEKIAEAKAEERIKKAAQATFDYMLQARHSAEHAEKLLKDTALIPTKSAEWAAGYIEEQVRKEAYASAEKNDATPAESKEARARRAAETVAAAAEPYHLAVLRAQKSIEENLQKSQRAADSVNKLAGDAMLMAKKANDFQALGEGTLAQQEMLRAHDTMRKSVDMKYWVTKFYGDANKWNNEIGTFQAQQQQAVASASGNFLEKHKPALPPMPTLPPPPSDIPSFPGLPPGMLPGTPVGPPIMMR